MKDYRELKEIILKNTKPVTVTGDWYEIPKPIDREKIQDALDKYKNVIIPDTGEPIVIDTPIIMRSNTHLKVMGKQRLIQAKDSKLCLIRNENIPDGKDAPADTMHRDENISIEGGIWHIKHNQRCGISKEKAYFGSLGSVIMSGINRVSLKNMIIHDSVELCGIGTSSASYGIQICNCESIWVENINFVDNARDGVHINGPIKYGVVKHIRGDKMGDDMVAMNAWDWDSSAITFGTIEYVWVEDLESNGNEFRLLPGQKVYESGEKVDCDIKNIVLENISGIYTFKLYAQPNIKNAIIEGYNDCSGTVGNISDVYFKNITFAKVNSTGFNDIPVNGLLDICSESRNLYLDDIKVANDIEQMKQMNVKLISVGPLSAVWTNGSDDPKDWGEIFDPDAICHADEIYCRNVTFNGVKVTDRELLTKEIKMTVNPDYPNTKPKGGTGYGTLGKVEAE